MNFFTRIGRTISRALRSPEAKALEAGLRQAAIDRAIKIVADGPSTNPSLIPAQVQHDLQVVQLVAQIATSLTGKPVTADAISAGTPKP